MDEISQKIIDMAMSLAHDKGYVTTTTEGIARQASVNEYTLFRRFKNKQGIMISRVSQEKWRANISREIFQSVQWKLRPGLETFTRAYMEGIAPDFVSFSARLRASQIYSETAPLIAKIPQAFLTAMTSCLEEMGRRGKIIARSYKGLAMTVFSSTSGYTFLKAPFQQELTKVGQREYIKNGVEVFIEGIARR